jgi:hypothetical protein
MALPVQRMAAEEIIAERAERKAKAAAMPANTPGQRLLREATLGLIEAREVSQSIIFHQIDFRLRFLVNFHLIISEKIGARCIMSIC